MQWLVYDPVRGDLKVLTNDTVPTRTTPLRLIVPELATLFHLLIYFVPRSECVSLLTPTSSTTTYSMSGCFNYVALRLLDSVLILETLSPTAAVPESSESATSSAHTISHYFDSSSFA
jgi:hypothetical protein